ncbi:hypothetical protein Tco_0325191 [Tanacetum coccineum]
MNTKFVNNLSAYWGKYVTNVKQNMDISTTPYVQIYTHLKAYEPHAKKTLKKQEQSISIVFLWPILPKSYFKWFPNAVSYPSNIQLPGTSSNSRTHATVHDGHIVTEPVQRKAPGNNGNTGTRGKKMMKAEAFLADVECTAPYDQPQALTTTNMFQANHEDAYDSDVDEGPNAAVAFMANLSSTSATNNSVNEVHSNDNQIFDNVDYQLNQEMHQGEHLDSDAETEIDDNTIPYHQYLLDIEAQNVPTETGTSPSVSKRNKRNAELVHEKRLLKIHSISGKEKSIAFLQSEKEKILSEKKDLADSYLDEIVCLKTANKVARDMLQRFNMPTQTIPMLSKKPKKATWTATRTPRHTSSEGHYLEIRRIGVSDYEIANYVSLQLKFQNYKQCIDTSSASNAIFEINKLRQQLQEKVTLSGFRLLRSASWKVLNVVPLKANTHSRTAYTEKLSALTTQHTKLQAQVTGATSSGPSNSETPKAPAPGMYTNSSKYIPPLKRANWVKPTPLPKKKQVTFQEPPRLQIDPTQKPLVQPKPRQPSFCESVYKNKIPLNSQNICQRATLGTYILPSKMCERVGGAAGSQ